jgi:hypothetical protein
VGVREAVSYSVEGEAEPDKSKDENCQETSQEHPHLDLGIVDFHIYVFLVDLVEVLLVKVDL